MNPYILGFQALSAIEQANAGRKVSNARGAIIWSRCHGGDPQEDDGIVRHLGLAGMAEFWEVELSEPMLCATFAQHVSLHFMVMKDRPGLTDEQRIQLGHAASRVVDGVEGGIRIALREARTNREPWFIELPEPLPSSKLRHPYKEVLIHTAVIGPPKQDYALVVPPDPPADGVDLSKLKLRPRPAIAWLLSMPRRQHLVPPSLVAVLRGQAVKIDIPSVLPSKPLRGRTKGTGYQKADEAIAHRMLEMVDNGEAQSLSEAARTLIGPDGRGAKGIGSVPAKVERLVKAASRLKRTENNRG